ncbi:MAG: nucleotidyltransferase family protein [Mongoliitalea sp.]
MELSLKAIDSISDVLKNFSAVEEAWVFGSFSRNELKPSSDIDIAIETDDKFSYFDLAEIKYLLEESLKRKVDIGFYDTIKPELLSEIKKDLQLIYERPKAN